MKTKILTDLKDAKKSTVFNVYELSELYKCKYSYLFSSTKEEDKNSFNTLTRNVIFRRIMDSGLADYQEIKDYLLNELNMPKAQAEAYAISGELAVKKARSFIDQHIYTSEGKVLAEDKTFIITKEINGKTYSLTYKVDLIIKKDHKICFYKFHCKTAPPSSLYPLTEAKEKNDYEYKSSVDGLIMDELCLQLYPENYKNQLFSINEVYFDFNIHKANHSLSTIRKFTPGEIWRYRDYMPLVVEEKEKFLKKLMSKPVGKHCDSCKYKDYCPYSKAVIELTEIKKNDKKEEIQPLLSSYSFEQTKTILNTDKNVMVVAPAGTGKTRTIVGKIGDLIENGAEPDTIMVTTFTNQAADEIINRLNYELDGIIEKEELKKLQVGTLHKLCYDKICENYEKLGFIKEPEVEKLSEINEIVKTVYNGINAEDVCKLNVDTRKRLFQNTLDMPFVKDNIAVMRDIFTGFYNIYLTSVNKDPFKPIKEGSLIVDRDEYKAVLKKNLVTSKSGYVKRDDEFFTEFTWDSNIVQDYENMKKNNLMFWNNLFVKFFNEMVQKSIITYDAILIIAKNFTDTLFESKIKYIIVDECQDSMVIDKIIYNNLSEKANQIMYFGDPNQQIFDFRDNSRIYSQSDEAKEAEKKYREAKKIMLTKNYRSSQQVINKANQVASCLADLNHKYNLKNKYINVEMKSNLKVKKDSLWTTIKAYDGSLVESFPFDTLSKLANKKSVCILAERRTDLSKIAQILTENKYPYYFEAKFKINDLPKVDFVRDLANNLLLIEDNKDIEDSVNWLTALLLLEQNGKINLNKEENSVLLNQIKNSLYQKYAGKDEITLEDFVEICKTITEKGSYEYKTVLNWIEKLIEVKEIENLKDFALFLENATKHSSNELINMELAPNGICLNTVHGSKGLEYDYVVYLEQCKNTQINEDTKKLEYVAITRAKIGAVNLYFKPSKK